MSSQLQNKEMLSYVILLKYQIIAARLESDMCNRYTFYDIMRLKNKFIL
jgi:hypothetical protein